MKTGAYTVLYAVISNMAILLCFAPVLLLCWRKMRQENAWWAIALYWLLNGLVNLPEAGLFQFSISRLWQERLTLSYNLAEAPLVLLAFACAASGKPRRLLLLLTFLFIAWEAALLGWKGYNVSSRTLLIGSGLLIILVYSITGLIQYVKRMEHTRLENSMIFIYAAFLFDYGSFLIIYIFAHIHNNGSGNGADSFLLYFISLLISAAVTTLGLWTYGIKKIQQGAHSGHRAPREYGELRRS